MEIQFEERPVRYLCRTAWGEKTVEETAEIKLPGQDTQPGQILGAWGQPCLTEKHWADGSVSVSGGVTVWVLLRAMDGVQSVPGWVPFRQSWELHDSQRDGKVIVRCSLKGVDARMTGAGKLIITAQISLYLQALETCTANRYVAEHIPEDIYLQRKCVSATVPVESGEKRVSMEEMISPSQPMETVLYYRLEPEVSECRVMGDKLVFRGEVCLCALCQGENEGTFVSRTSFPVSQYIQLDGDYGSKAIGDVIPVVLSAEAEKTEDGQIAFRGNVLWQYVLHDEIEIDTIMDVYSNQRSVEAEIARLCIPALCAREKGQQEVACVFAAENGTVVDCAVMSACAEWDDRTGKLQQEGAARVLYYDGEHVLQSALLPFSVETAAEQEDGGYCVVAWQCSPEVMSEAQDGINIRIPYLLYTMDERSQRCCKGFSSEDEMSRSDNRPCLILRRANGEDLWSLAKASGSSETAIRRANGLEGCPEKGKMLIIPVE